MEQLNADLILNLILIVATVRRTYLPMPVFNICRHARPGKVSILVV